MKKRDMSHLTDDHYDIIERFFNGELNKAEQVEFDQLMQHSDFREAVMLQNSLRKTLVKERQESPLMQVFKQEAQQYKKDTTSKEQNSSKSFLQKIPYYVYPIAAMVLLLISGSWWANSHYSNNSILQELHDPILDNKQASIPSGKEILDKAKNAFFAGEYEKATRLIARIDEQQTALFYEAQGLLAYTYFRNNQFAKSINQFNLLIDNYYSKLPIHYQDQHKLRWTRLLCYLGEGQETDPFFQKELDYFLTCKSEIYRIKAKSLQNKMSSFWRKLVF